MAQTRFHHIALISRRLEDTVKFYQDGIGLDVWHVWGRKNIDYIMALGNGSYMEIMEEQHDEPMPRGQWTRVYFKSDHIAKSYARALAAGASPLETPRFVTEEDAAPFLRPYWTAAVTGLEGEEIGFIQEIGDDEPHQEKVHHISLLVNDVEKSSALFRQAFSLYTGRMAHNNEKRTLVDMGDNTYLELIQNAFSAPMRRGVWAHIAIKAKDIHKDYQQAVDAGAHPNAKPIFCDVTEATPFPVQFWAAAVGGCDGEDLTLLQDIII